jgi:hypothetical protein
VIKLMAKLETAGEQAWPSIGFHFGRLAFFIPIAAPDMFARVMFAADHPRHIRRGRGRSQTATCISIAAMLRRFGSQRARPTRLTPHGAPRRIRPDTGNATPPSGSFFRFPAGENHAGRYSAMPDSVAM